MAALTTEDSAAVSRFQKFLQIPSVSANGAALVLFFSLLPMVPFNSNNATFAILGLVEEAWQRRQLRFGLRRLQPSLAQIFPNVFY